MNASDVLPAQFNVASWFVDKNVAEGRGASPAFLHEDRTLTYADVQELVNRTGNALLELGVEMETRVLMLCLDAPEFIGTFWGAIKIGAVPVPVNTLMRTADYLYFLGDSRAKVAVISAPLLAEAAPALVDAKRLKHVLIAGGNHGQFVSYEDRIAKASATLEAAPTSRDDAAFWQYSSGSTGFPKGAVHLHHDMVVCCETYGKQVLGIRPTDRVYSAAKLFFAYGLGNACFFPMGVGAQSVLYPHRPTPESVFELIARYRPTLFFGVPTLYAGMLAVKEAEVRFDTSSLRLCVSAGEALPDEIYRRWRERFGVEIIDGIGTTEIGHIFSRTVPAPPARAPRGSRCRATSSRSWTMRGARCRRGRSATSASRATPRWPTTGTSTTRRKRRSSARGSRRVTSTTRTGTATSGTAAARTTCSRSGGSGSHRSRSRRRSYAIPRG